MKNNILLLLLLFISGYLFAGVSEEQKNGEIGVTGNLGPAQMEQKSDWIGSDTLIGQTSQDSESQEFKVRYDFLNWVYYPCQGMPKFLALKNRAYFVCVYGEENVVFKVLYCDVYNNAVSSGYPKVLYWQAQSSTITLKLDYVGKENNSLLYQKEVALLCGKYYYKYIVKNDILEQDYEMAQSSFVVKSKPASVKNEAYQGNIVTPNAKVVLKWSSSDPEGGALKYNLYLGTDPNNLILVYQSGYSGGAPVKKTLKEASMSSDVCCSYELKNLGFNMVYYWQVEALDEYGVTTKSSVFSFSTVSQNLVEKAFNYPNPFNPAKSQATNIVFNMAESGSADIKIYTELGDLCWSNLFDNLNAGANEILYNGKDDSGNLLYNGTYVCIIDKKYPNRKERNNCRMLVIK
ncbi:MAG: hypothetical protein LHV68_02360 [Elusimicrobia bacterium]|nr:hypothetical protein [Candidatus Liberimonas magnetica]